MNAFRDFLIFLRKTSNKIGTVKAIVICSFLAACSIGVGFLIDSMLPFYNSFYSILRCFVCTVSSIPLFSALFLLSTHLYEARIKKQPDYVAIRDRHSLEQRRNLAIVAGVILVIISLLAGRPSPFYSLYFVFILVAAYALLAFIRPKKEELLKLKAGLPDSRDIVHYNKMEKKSRK